MNHHHHDHSGHHSSSSGMTPMIMGGQTGEKPIPKGTFMGHVLPGSFFLGFACWWCCCIFTRYHRCRLDSYGKRQASMGTYRSTLTFPIKCRCWQKPVLMEAVFKVICCTVGVTGEIWTGFDRNWHWYRIGNGQHATMFTVFGFSGIVDLLLYHGQGIPVGIDYVYMAACFAVEGTLFKFHLHGRTEADVVVHTLLVYTIACCIASLLAELRWPKSVLPALARVFFVGLQGTWFIQVAFLLYPPIPGMRTYDEGNQHENVMLVTIIFGWHCFFIAAGMMTVCLVTARFEARKRGYGGAKLAAASGNGVGAASSNRADLAQLVETGDENLSDLDGYEDAVAS